MFRFQQELRVVMVGLLALGLVPSVPTIHSTARAGVRGALDPRDKPEDDSAGAVASVIA